MNCERRERIRRHQCIAYVILWVMVIVGASIVTFTDIAKGPDTANIVLGSYVIPILLAYILFITNP